MERQVGDMTNSNLSAVPAGSSSPGNPFHGPTTNVVCLESVGAAQQVHEKYDHGTQDLGLSAMKSSQNPFMDDATGIEQGHESMARRNLRTDPVALIGEDGSNPSAVSPGHTSVSSTNRGPEIQNPPLQVMDRSEEDTALASASLYKIPSHVFDRTSTTTPVEWSTASNESLFSIHMGNMSFSKDLACFKSGEFDKFGDFSMPSAPNSSQNIPPPPGNKFNDMSQRTAEQDRGSGVTEAKAAETMREVIMENTERNIKDDLPSAEGGVLQSNPSNMSGHSDGSAKSFAFQQSMREVGKSTNGSSRHSEGKPEQGKHSKPPSSKEKTEQERQQSEPSSSDETTKRADEIPKTETTKKEDEISKTAPTNNKRFSCFACCPFC